MPTRMPKLRRPHRPFHALLLVGISLVAPIGAGAATVTVTTDLDSDVDDSFCSLREAIVAANDDAAYHGCSAGAGADRIVFSLALPATIALGSDLPVIASTLAIRGPGADQLAIDGQDLHRLLRVNPPIGIHPWLGVEELTLTRGLAPDHGGGARIVSGAVGYFRRVRFLSNRATNGGGGLAVTTLGVAGVEECWFSGNVALGPSGGGGIAAFGPSAQILIDRTTISGNHADAATAAAGGLAVKHSSVTVTRSTISGNSATGSGGGILLQSAADPASLVLHDSTVTNNVSDSNLNNVSGKGGGIAADSSVLSPATLELRNTIIAGNLDSNVSSGSNVHPDVSLGSNLVFDSLGFNLIGSNAGSTAYLVAGLPNGDGDWVGSDGAAIDPELGALLPSGGFGPSHAPTDSPTSRVVDHGSCPGSGSDQRGYGNTAAHVRIVDLPVANGAGSDGCDVGAHELGGGSGTDPGLFADDFEAGHLLYWDRSTP
ncbi:MAG: right-handed parallel beta-helix repeat-containing protein [Acidobacteria bacterium]|nr:right-handed parallel beta-helix repeat-containing protein [Acidobacteriota bacterium]